MKQSRRRPAPKTTPTETPATAALERRSTVAARVLADAEEKVHRLYRWFGDLAATGSWDDSDFVHAVGIVRSLEADVREARSSLPAVAS